MYKEKMSGALSLVILDMTGAATVAYFNKQGVNTSRESKHG